MRTATLFLILMLPAALAAQSVPTPLTRAIAAEIERFPARTGVYVKHLSTGEEAAVRADQSFNSAA